MAIYSSNRAVLESWYSEEPTQTLEDIMHDDSIIPSASEDMIENGYDIILNMEENYNIIMQNIGLNELQVLESTGEELVYTEGVLKSVFNAVKKFLMKVWEKIKALFKRFIMVIDSYTKNDKEFINKYRKIILRNSSNLTDFTFKGYKWRLDDNSIQNINSALGAANPADVTRIIGHITFKKPRDAIDSFKYWFDQNFSEVHIDIDSFKVDVDQDKAQRKKVADCFRFFNIKNVDTVEEARKEFHEWLRNGQDTKEELDDKDINVMEIMSELLNSNDLKKNYTRLYKTNERTFKTNEKDILNLHKAISNGSMEVSSSLSQKYDVIDVKTAKAATDDNHPDHNKAVKILNKYWNNEESNIMKLVIGAVDDLLDMQDGRWKDKNDGYKEKDGTMIKGLKDLGSKGTRNLPFPSVKLPDGRVIEGRTSPDWSRGDRNWVIFKRNPNDRSVTKKDVVDALINSEEGRAWIMACFGYFGGDRTSGNVNSEIQFAPGGSDAAFKEKAKRLMMKILQSYQIVLGVGLKIQTMINSETLQAFKERSRQYKSCLISIVHYNRKKNEDVVMENTIFNTTNYNRFAGSSSFLSNIRLV